MARKGVPYCGNLVLATDSYKWGGVTCATNEAHEMMVTGHELKLAYRKDCLCGLRGIYITSQRLGWVVVCNRTRPPHKQLRVTKGHSWSARKLACDVSHYDSNPLHLNSTHEA
jgi:hypothetical protein